MSNKKQEELAALLPKTRVWEDWKRMWRSHVLRYMLDDGGERVLVVLSIPRTLRKDVDKKLTHANLLYDCPKDRWSMFMKDEYMTPIVARPIDMDDEEEQEAAMKEVRDDLVYTYEPMSISNPAEYVDSYPLAENLRKRPAPNMDIRNVKRAKHLHENCLLVEGRNHQTEVLWFNEWDTVYTRGEYLATTELALMKTVLGKDTEAVETIMSFVR